MKSKIISIIGEAVTLEEAEAHLRFECDDDIQTELLQRCINSATKYAEDYTGLSVREQEIEIALNEFPECGIKLPKHPILEINSVKYIDRDGVEQTVDANNYFVDDYEYKPELRPVHGFSWPSTRKQVNAVKVNYNAGYEDAYVPDGIKSAILLLVSDLHANRDAQTEKPLTPNQAVNNLLNFYRVSLGV